MGPQPFDQIVDRHLLGAERLHIRWRGFASNLMGCLESLVLQTTATTDAWLVGKDGAAFRVHRLVLAASSDLLKEVMLDGSLSSDDPVLLLDQVERQTIEDFLSYLYRGQVTLNPPRLAALLAFGQTISLKGIGALQQQAAAGQQPQPTPPSWSSTEASPPFTGLSLLASAALKAEEDPLPPASPKRRRLSSGGSFNDENDPLNGNKKTSSDVYAINLSTRDHMMVVKEEERPSLIPRSSLLNIPDPANFKWRRCTETDVVSKEEPMERDDTPPPLAIDMSTTTPPTEPLVTDLPATPSPSPSSLNGSASTILSGGNNGPFFLDPFVDQGQTPPSTLGEEAIKMMEANSNSRSSSQSMQQPASGEGKKWKSRQPKLCVHCDRYFSNQFNLKQHILNMHTIGGDVRCDKCNKTVKNKWYLRRHQVTHHNAPLKK